jgi:hypothetical protein
LQEGALKVFPRARCELRRLNPRGSVPAFDIDGAVLVAFSPGAVKAAVRRAAEARVAREDNG